MMELSELFDLTMIINAPHRTDRRRDMRAALQRVGWNPDDPKVIWYPAVDPRNPAGFGSPGIRGCFLSHVAVMNIAQNQRCRRVLILEDDCEFEDDFPARQAEVASWLKSESWGIAYLGHAQPMEGTPGLRQWPHEFSAVLAHCYAVSGEVLPKMAGYLEGFPLRPPGSSAGGPMFIDGAINWFRRDNPDVETKAVMPSLAYQRAGRSDLTPRWFDRIPLLPKIVGRTAAARAR